MTNNPIAWAQFQLRGGWRTSLLFCGVYACAIVGFYSFAHSTDPRNFGRPGGWINLLLGIQSAALLLFGTSRIGTAIRNDLSSRMIESHRLMPTPPPFAIAGYLLGGASQALLAFATTFVIGAVLSATAGLTTDRWILSNAILLVFAIFVWSIVSLFSFVTTKGVATMGAVIGLFFIISATSGLVTAFMPALTILCSPIMGDSIFLSPGGGAAPSIGYGASLVGQVLIGSLYFFAASRRYRSADSTGFTPSMALALVAAWVAITLFAMLNWKQIQPAFVRRMAEDLDLPLIQAIASIAATMLLSLLALATSSRATFEWNGRRAIGDPGLGRRPLHPALAAILCAGLCLAITIGVERSYVYPLGDDYLLNRVHLSPWLAAIVTTAAIALSFIFSCSYLLRIMHRVGVRGTIIVAIFVVITWFGPLMAEVVRNVLRDDARHFIWTRVTGLSPIGALILAWTEAGADPMAGVLVQATITVVLAMLFHLTARRRRERLPSIGATGTV